MAHNLLASQLNWSTEWCLFAQLCPGQELNKLIGHDGGMGSGN